MNFITFTSESVQAILDDAKTQTRRVISGVKERHCHNITEFGVSRTVGYDYCFRDRKLLWYDVRLPWLLDRCPFGRVGSRLWVKESWRIESWDRDGQEYSFQYRDGKTSSVFDLYYQLNERTLERYRTQCEEDCRKAGWHTDAHGMFYPPNDTSEQQVPTRWRSPMFMPHQASRLTIELVDVRVERLGSISPSDCRHEGFRSHMKFREAWNGINARRGFSFESDPWVWVLKFRRVES